MSTRAGEVALQELHNEIQAMESLRITLVTTSSDSHIGSSDFLSLVRSWHRAAIILRKHGLETPDAQLDSNDRVKIVAAMREHLPTLAEMLNTLKSMALDLETALILERAALEYPKAPEAFDTLSDNLKLSDSGRHDLHDKVNELRRLIDKADWTTEEHKNRILERLARLQGEMDRPVASFGRIFSGLAVLGDAIGQFAKKADPAVDQVERLILAVRGEKKGQNAIDKDKDPLQIPDLRE